MPSSLVGRRNFGTDTVSEHFVLWKGRATTPSCPSPGRHCIKTPFAGHLRSMPEFLLRRSETISIIAMPMPLSDKDCKWHFASRRLTRGASLETLIIRGMSISKTITSRIIQPQVVVFDVACHKRQSILVRRRERRGAAGSTLLCMTTAPGSEKWFTCSRGSSKTLLTDSLDVVQYHSLVASRPGQRMAGGKLGSPMQPLNGYASSSTRVISRAVRVFGMDPYPRLVAHHARRLTMYPRKGREVVARLALEQMIGQWSKTDPIRIMYVSRRKSP
jgi:hypothetical protein